ncbi:MAG: aminotransferase DegT [Lachnospiraceae bacterium]|jgi:perosamine synthetase|nr:aminotransferase DegT [Lachnospiraceae bacterium]
MIPIFKPFMPDIPEIDSILHSGMLAYGSYTKEFEEKLKAYFGTPYLFVTNSFHLAISVVLSALEVCSGECVIASPMACLASTQPYLSNGLHVCWADVDPRTGTLSPDSVRKQITSKTKAIVHNHFCGYPGYIDEINAIGNDYGIPVIDDGIECFGSEYKGKKVGNCGTDITIFSLSAVRIPNCIDGGIIIFKEKELYKKSLLIRDCGIDRTKFRDSMGEISLDCDINLIGYSATMSNVNGYIGLCQMRHVENLIQKQRKQADLWESYLEKVPGIFLLTRKEIQPNYWVYGILTENKRDVIQKFRENGFYASGVHMMNHIYSVFGKQNVVLSGVEEFYKRFLALPCGWWMNKGEGGHTG